MAEETKSLPTLMKALLAVLAVAAIAVMSVVVYASWFPSGQAGADAPSTAAKSRPCPDGQFLLPEGVCEVYDPDAIYWQYTDHGLHFIDEADQEPAMIHTVIEKYKVDMELGATAGLEGIIGIEFENQCFPIDQSMAEQGLELVLPSADDPMVETDVAPEARSFIKRLFTLGGMDIDMIELGFGFRVYFREVVGQDQIDPYVIEVFTAMVESGWCASQSGSSV